MDHGRPRVRCSRRPVIVWSSTSPASRSWSYVDDRRQAPSVLQRLSAPRRRAGRTRPARRAGRSAGDPMPLPLVDLRARRRAAPSPVPRTGSADDLAEVALHSVGRRRVGRVRLRAPRPERHPSRCRHNSVRFPIDSAAIRSTSCSEGLTFTYDVAANWKVLAENYNECYHCGPVHPTLCELVPAFRRGGTGLDWPDGIPHRPGAWTFTTTGIIDRPPFPDLDELERVRHKGELVYPNLLLSLSAEHVAAFRLVPDGAGADHGRRAICCSTPTPIAELDFDPSDAGDLWDSGQPAGLGDLRERAARHVVASVDAAAGSPRWRTTPPTSPAGTPRCDERDDRWLITPSAWSGWVDSGRPRRTGWPAAASTWSGSSSSSSATSAERRTITRASSAARITRPTTSALTAARVRRVGSRSSSTPTSDLIRGRAASTCFRPMRRSTRSRTGAASTNVA